jgi:hypothetical protein
LVSSAKAAKDVASTSAVTRFFMVCLPFGSRRSFMRRRVQTH